MQVFRCFLLVFSTSYVFGLQLPQTETLEQALFTNNNKDFKRLLQEGKSLDGVSLEKIDRDKAWKDLIFSHEDPPQLGTTFHAYMELIKSYQNAQKKLLTIKLHDKENIAERIMQYAGFEQARKAYFESKKNKN